MKKKQEEKYEEPQTKRTQVSLESSICVSSVEVKNPDRENGRIEEHEVNTDFDYNFDDQGWDR